VTLAERIRATRLERQMSQEALAYQAGMSLRAYRSLERGEALDPHISTIRNISGALGVSLYMLLGELGASEGPAVPKAGAPPSPAEQTALDEERRSPVVLDMLTEIFSRLRDEHFQEADEGDVTTKRAEEIALRAEGAFELGFGVYYRLDLANKPRTQREQEFASAFEDFCASLGAVLLAAAENEPDEQRSASMRAEAKEWKQRAAA
jgi:transcriptional regulator with XRE-family HTH domain